MQVGAGPVVLDLAPGGLCRIHRDVRPLQQDVPGDRVIGIDRDPDADVDVEAHPVDVEGAVESGQHPLGNSPRRGGVGILQEHGELVAAETGQ